jgi:hypothetical protein
MTKLKENAKAPENQDEKRSQTECGLDEERRSSVVDRRLGLERRQGSEGYQGEERRKGKDRRSCVEDRRLGLDRHRGPGRRRSDDRRNAEEGHMTDEQFHFLMAIDEYKRKSTRPFPTWTEVLEVIKALGYRKVAEPQFLAPPREDDSYAEGEED